MSKPNNIDKSILISGISDIEELKRWGHYLGQDEEGGLNKLSTSQIRKFFGAVKKIQADFDNAKNEIVLLNPKIAYAVGRDFDKKKKKNKTKIIDFYNLLNPLIDDIKEDKKKFKNFVNVLEAVVAYHKEKSGD